MQRSSGNAAVGRLLGERNRELATRGRSRVALQRLIRIDDRIRADSGLANAILQFHAIEQRDLSPAEFALLRQHHQRFMPLLGRFALARGTTLLITTGGPEVGDMALTSLLGFKAAGRVDEEDERPTFYDDVKNKRFNGFTVKIAFRSNRVKPPGNDPYALNHVGQLLQAFTHEMTVHAENMLDFIERYWAYVDGGGHEPPPLLTSSAEHAAFKQGIVPRYEFMKSRAANMPGQAINVAFDAREVADKASAK